MYSGASYVDHLMAKAKFYLTQGNIKGRHTIIMCMLFDLHIESGDENSDIATSYAYVCITIYSRGSTTPSILCFVLLSYANKNVYPMVELS